jgi:hypothetical protein
LSKKSFSDTREPQVSLTSQMQINNMYYIIIFKKLE